jgi:molecular chaperone DnaJ
MQVGRRTLLGTITTIATCDRCGGRGEVVTSPCPACRGRRVVDEDTEVSVEIPAGVEDGTRLRLRGRGGASADGGDPGDLYVEVRVGVDERFARHGDDLVHVAGIGITEAALGTAVEVPLLEGDGIEVDVPRGTQPGTVIRLPGKGMGRLHRRGRGDLLVEVSVAVPTDLSADEERLLREFAASRQEQPARPRRLRRSR